MYFFYICSLTNDCKKMEKENYECMWCGFISR